MKRIVSFILLFSLLLLSGCAKNGKLLNDKYLIVATSPDYAPYEFIDTTKTGMDRYVGADVELMKYIANEMGLELKIEEMSFETCLVAVQTKKVDIAISGFSWTPRRAENYELSNTYFGEGDGLQQILILKENSDKFKTLDDLNKSTVKVGAQTGSLQEELVDTQLPKAKKELVTNLDMAISFLLSGTIDALAISEYAANVRLEANDALQLLPQNFDTPLIGNVVVAKKGNIELIEEINTIIDKVLEQNLYNQWMEEAIELANELGEDID
ncbi:MAG TPA: transporter substrate-binding domain-containing protein [Bacilli bacterium]